MIKCRLFIYGSGTFYDGNCWANKGENADFNGEELIVYQVYEIREVE